MPSGDWSYLKLSLTNLRLISSETLETLRPNFPAMNRRDFFFFKNLSIFLRSNKTKCLKFSINLILECSDSKVNESTLKKTLGIEPKHRKAQSMKTQRKTTTPSRAREIMKDRVLGAEDLKQVFGVKLEEPSIPIPEALLERLGNEGRLILYTDRWNNRKPMTPLSIVEKFENKKADGTKILYGFEPENWKRRENFFIKETPFLKWRLVMDEPLPGNTYENYLQQTLRLGGYLKGLYDRKNPIPTDIAAMIKGAKKLAINISDDVESGNDTLWKPAAEHLSLLPLNRHFRESFPELLYRLVLLDRARGVQLLQHMHSWTNSRSSVGFLVLGGGFGANGADVFRQASRSTVSNVGLFLSAERF